MITVAISRFLELRILAVALPMPTLAQAIAIGLAAALTTIVVWIVHRLLKKSELAREMEHVERLRSIEAGLPWHCHSGTGHEVEKAQRSQMDNAFWIAFWLIVVGVTGPFHAVSSLLVTELGRSDQLAVAAVLAAGAASVTASVCAVAVVRCSRPKSESPSDSGSTSVRHV